MNENSERSIYKYSGIYRIQTENFTWVMPHRNVIIIKLTLALNPIVSNIHEAKNPEGMEAIR